jgi:hypothetical protein
MPPRTAPRHGGKLLPARRLDRETLLAAIEDMAQAMREAGD